MYIKTNLHNLISQFTANSFVENTGGTFFQSIFFYLLFGVTTDQRMK